jgi:dTDP-glucose 4,6-dehydratase
VIHFAAQTHVDNSFGNSLEFTIDNILGTHTLLECCRVYNKIKRFIHISTDEVYGEVDIDHKGCSEKSLLNPTNPYAATKAGAEFIVRSYYYSFNMPVIITRGNNVYGPRQYPEKLIPKFINQLLNNEKCTIHGVGETRRNFIYVDDVAKAVEIILQKGIVNNIYNIGTNNEYSVSEIADKLIKYLKPNDKVEDWIQYVTDRNFNDYRYAIESKELRNLGWQEETGFDKGFEHTIEWFKKK